jgi:hypothetical protein
MELPTTIGIIYGAGFTAFLFLNALVAGWAATSITREDVYDSLMWPLSLTTLIGTLARLIFDITMRRREMAEEAARVAKQKADQAAARKAKEAPSIPTTITAQ